MPLDQAAAVVEDRLRRGTELMDRSVPDKAAYDAWSADISTWHDWNRTWLNRYIGPSVRQEYAHVGARVYSADTFRDDYGERLGDLTTSLRRLGSIKDRLSLWADEEEQDTADHPVASDTYDAAICRRGHMLDDMLGEPRQKYMFDKPSPAPLAPTKCSTCGGAVLTSCPDCGAPLPGKSRDIVVRLFGGPGDFCTHCGAPFPWAGRQAMIYRLQNLLDEEESAGLNPAARRALAEALDELQQPSLPIKEHRAIWSRVKHGAPTFITNPTVLKILTQLIEDPAVRKSIGL